MKKPRPKKESAWSREARGEARNVGRIRSVNWDRFAPVKKQKCACGATLGTAVGVLFCGCGCFHARLACMKCCADSLGAIEVIDDAA